ncbi:MAG: hypothetical protein GXO87_02455 [Chlorobi bacterium]|nr:hypothetical protein [Chlorobiota bacterium]
MGLITEKWTVEEGLPSNRIFKILKDENGFIWFATDNGLVRFDGLNFKIYNSDNQPLFKKNLIRNFFADSQGRILFTAGTDKFIILENESFRYDENSTFDYSSINKSFITSDGTIWLSSFNKGILKYSNGQFTNLDTLDEFGGYEMRAVSEDRNGGIWIVTTDNKILFYSNNRFIEALPESLCSNLILKTIFFDSKNRLWIGTQSGIVIVENNRFVNNKSLNALDKFIIRKIIEDREGNIWISTYNNGLFVLSGNTLIPLSKELGLNIKGSSGISDVFINDGLIWLGTYDDGALLLRKSFLNVIGKEDGLNSEFVNSFYNDSDGSVLIGTKEGLFRLPPSGKFNQIEKTGYCASNHIYSIARDNEGNLLVGTRFFGLFYFKKDSVLNYNIANGLKSNFIRTIFVGKDGTILLGTNSGGVSVIEDGKFRQIDLKHGLSSNLISFIYKSKDSRYWIGTSRRGVNIIDTNGHVSVINSENGLIGDVVSSIYEDENGVIWLSVNGGGLSRIEKGHITNFTQKDGLYNNKLLNIIDDKKGKFWFPTSSGIFSVKKEDFEKYRRGEISKLRYVLFSKTEGMKSERCVGASPQSAILGQNEYLFFSTISGAVVIDPAVQFKKENELKLFIDGALVNYKPVKKSDLLSIPPSPERIEFLFAAIDFRNPNDVNLTYKLEGYDKDWLEARGERATSYLHVPFGEYVFKIRAVSSGNFTEPKTAEIRINILPHIWETFWFQALSFLLLIVLIVSTTKYFYTLKYQRQLKIIGLERALEKERSRISKDMHDEVGANLTKMSLLCEIAKNKLANPVAAKKYLDQITGAGVEVASSLDELVWAVNPKNDRLEKLFFYIIQYVEDFLSLTDCKFSFKFPEEIPDKFISAEVRHNIFSVIKEAMNNAVKYSEGENIFLEFKLIENKLEIIFNDDGKGIDFAKVGEFSNGLSNMKTRIDDIGGTLKIYNREKGGVEIYVSFEM